jgi:hypothetical protein
MSDSMSGKKSKLWPDLTYCSTCSSGAESYFSEAEEGGLTGDFGLIPVAFCPTCLACLPGSGAYDMADQLWGDDDDGN